MGIEGKWAAPIEATLAPHLMNWRTKMAVIVISLLALASGLGAEGEFSDEEFKAARSELAGSLATSSCSSVRAVATAASYANCVGRASRSAVTAAHSASS